MEEATAQARYRPFEDLEKILDLSAREETPEVESINFTTALPPAPAGYKTKVCAMCDESKKVGEFSVNRRRKDGRATACKACLNAAGKAAYAKQKAATKARRCSKCGIPKNIVHDFPKRGHVCKVCCNLRLREWRYWRLAQATDVRTVDRTPTASRIGTDWSALDVKERLPWWSPRTWWRAITG